MSFFGLSREIRNLIYHAVLCPPDGVRLDSRVERRWRNPKPDDEDEDEDEGEEVERSRKPDISALIPVPTAIFYVNHQVRQEATEAFYGFNRFTFDTDTHAALNFLKCIRSSSRRHIKDIGFTRRSTCADDAGCTEFWEPLCTFIFRCTSICSVTIQVPRDCNHGIDEAKESSRAPNGEFYWWPAARLLAKGLMAGKIQKLKIGYSATLKVRPSEEAALDMEVGQSQHENPLETLEAISHLRYPQPQEELDREYLETKEFARACREGGSHKFTSLSAFQADQQTRRQRLDFVVAREDDQIGDVGTVLVLTRPTES